MPGLPLFIVADRRSDSVPEGDPPYTFVTDGVEAAVARARSVALLDKHMEAERTRNDSHVDALWAPETTPTIERFEV
jgi:hypothetical protein